MVGNYNINANVEFARWNGEDPDPVDQRRCELSELYFDPDTGDLVLTFGGRDSEDFFDVSVPVKATADWNNFADALPRFNL